MWEARLIGGGRAAVVVVVAAAAVAAAAAAPFFGFVGMRPSQPLRIQPTQRLEARASWGP